MTPNPMIPSPKYSCYFYVTPTSSSNHALPCCTHFRLSMITSWKHNARRAPRGTGGTRYAENKRGICVKRASERPGNGDPYHVCMHTLALVWCSVSARPRPSHRLQKPSSFFHPAFPPSLPPSVWPSPSMESMDGAMRWETERCVHSTVPGNGAISERERQREREGVSGRE